MAVDLAHNHWQLGEKYAARGHYLESLLHYEKARSLSESNTAIYRKYSESHGRVVNILQHNPVLTLQLQRGFTKKDVRRAYRRIVLIYHPDKNNDCDTSAIFTIIQSAYEELLASAPEEPKLDSLPARHRDMKRTKDAPPPTEMKEGSSMEVPSRAKNPSRNADDGEVSKAKEASRPSAAHTLSTEELRDRVSRLKEGSGGRSLESMNRGELMREYLLHLRREPSQPSSSGAGFESRDLRRKSEREENRYLSQWMDAIRSVLGKEMGSIEREVGGLLSLFYATVCV